MGLARPSVRWLADAPPRSRHVALGSFDGVHLGHRRVIASADTVVTFSPHPRAVVGEAPVLLQDFDRKVELLGHLGVSEVVLIPFDRQLAAMSPSEFVTRVLVDALSVERVSVGANFRFGRRGAGTVADLVADRRLQTRVEPLLTLDGEVVSSTRIRALIEAGAVEAAARLLGDPFEIHCSVERVDDGRVRIVWPEGIVEPRLGTYRASFRPSLGDAVPAEVAVSADGIWLHRSDLLPDDSAPHSVALLRHVREAAERR